MQNQPWLSSLHDSQMSYSDDYDDVAELADLHSDSLVTISSTANERTIRRRSSKACDQCRKSKCKCERAGPNQQCKSCAMLGTPCTFLGPSRKRGPPKGYIDAIEARLHQTEALLGIMLATNDTRAQSLLRDVAKDPLAREIITRVDNSQYGVKGRKRDELMGKKMSPSGSGSPPATQTKTEADVKPDLVSMHPSNEWQDRVANMLNSPSNHTNGEDHYHHAERSPPSRSSPNGLSPSSHSHSNSKSNNLPDPNSSRPNLSLRVDARVSPASDDSGNSPGRRQRRRVSPPGSAVSLDPDALQVQAQREYARGERKYAHGERSYARVERRSSSPVESVSSMSEEELTGAVGQLSLNEDEQVRYHGKASGLHLLGDKERVDGRNKGGIWRFPKARVWPPLPSSSPALHGEDEYVSQLPSFSTQEHLLDLYFTYVHASFPIIYKSAFFEAYKHTTRAASSSPSCASASPSSSSSTFSRRHQHIPTLLLLAMFALAARYDSSTLPTPPAPASSDKNNDNSNNSNATDADTDAAMWGAGDEYLDRAKVILDKTYASSRATTVQALLLMGYREIGIGAMAQAWTYIGMGIRMAQDLGLHRSADGWVRVGLGGRLFGEGELHERKRVWYGCVIMDKYVSTYIGRPLMIFERDFDTLMPNESDPEEMDDWSLNSANLMSAAPPQNIPCRVISCFNASASLSGILSMIVQSIYAVRPVSSRHTEAALLEGVLDKWYLELPEHLGAPKHPTALPHVLTLHMQYWCAVLLLHRPFIRHVYTRHKQGDDSDEGEGRAMAEKSYELCASAANHITTIVASYAEKYSLQRCSVFLCYYVFTASIMHVTSLTAHPSDPQARIGLSRCMDALRSMETVWPSARRALELLRGAKVNLGTSPQDIAPLLTHAPDRYKRAAEYDLDDSSSRNGAGGSGSVVGVGVSVGMDVNVGIGGVEELMDDYISVRGNQSVVVTPQANGGMYSYANGYVTPHVSAGYRWPPQGDMASSLFNAPLSTSVLPQLYSMVDERGDGVNRNNEVGGMSGHGSGGRMHSADQQQQQMRYPQFWNDYSTFPQLAAAAYDVNEQAHHQAAAAATAAAQIYMADQQYSIYNNSYTGRH